MTRLTEADVGGLSAALDAFEAGLRSVAGLDLAELALRTAAVEPALRITAAVEPARPVLRGARAAAVPISQGQGFIPGFCRCVATILAHIGCDSWVTGLPDVRGIQEAVDAEAEVIFLADDSRFIALSLIRNRCIDNDLATADGYVTALDAAAHGLTGRHVLLLGLGPVGCAAARRLVSHRALVLVVEPDAERVSAALEAGLAIEPVGLAEGLCRCDLIFDATPAAGLIDAGDIGAATVAAVPGLPSAFTPAAQKALGARHIHEPLAVGVAVMAARALL